MQCEGQVRVRTRWQITTPPPSPGLPPCFQHGNAQWQTGSRREDNVKGFDCLTCLIRDSVDAGKRRFLPRRVCIPHGNFGSGAGRACDCDSRRGQAVARLGWMMYLPAVAVRHTEQRRATPGTVEPHSRSLVQRRTSAVSQCCPVCLFCSQSPRREESARRFPLQEERVLPGIEGGRVRELTHVRTRPKVFTV